MKARLRQTDPAAQVEPRPGFAAQAATAPGRVAGARQSNFERERFLAAVERIREYIYAGDAFQIVLSQRFERPVDVSGFSIYRGLRAVNPSPYMYYIAFRDFEVVGSSPEPLVTVTGRRAETRPIAGTRPRGATPAEDAALAEEMLTDEKERAEHLMLVDLGRNDLGRVCRPGTVKTVGVHGGGALQPRDAHGVVGGGRVGGRRATPPTPCGPSSRPAPSRGRRRCGPWRSSTNWSPPGADPYAGAIGYLSYSGDLDSCIYIRTILVRDGRAYVQAGAGIVADSDPEREFVETENKARAMFRAIELATAQEEWE